MDADERWVVPLTGGDPAEESLVGGKATGLVELAREGFEVPKGYCVTVRSYEKFVSEAKLVNVIEMELGRKPLSDMRWEEIWDAALRIRSAFLAASVPEPIEKAVRDCVRALGDHTPLAVRSSAPGEDSAERSFAGLHESLLEVVGADAVLDALRVVWASLWSDAALLYRKELSLDPRLSRMAVVIQEMRYEDRSGVAFGRDPRDPKRDHAIVEAIEGPCSLLVDGLVDPDRWVLDRSTGEVVEWRSGEKSEAEEARPILLARDLDTLRGVLERVEAAFGWPPDLEWTGRGPRLTLLQARPVTTAVEKTEDTRQWYLELKPGPRKLEELCRRVVEELIPELQSLGEELAAENLEAIDDSALASAVERRLALVERWRKVYWDEFIPFAHGVRRLATYYNDHVRPEDPYEFVGLLKGAVMLASERNRSLIELASRIAAHPALKRAISEVLEESRHSEGSDWRSLLSRSKDPEVVRFWEELQDFESRHLDIAYDGKRLASRDDLIIPILAEMMESPSRPQSSRERHPRPGPTTEELERRLLAAVGEDRRREAEEVLRVARLSWKLRDDDNLLLGRVESQLLRAVDLAADRLRLSGRLEGGEPDEKDARALAEALRDPAAGPVALTQKQSLDVPEYVAGREVPRQMIGQPAAPGMASGRARRIRHAEDLARFRAGEVLVCDAIQPTMSHLVPLAVAVVERRGGMLIHGAIIARELGIPCVNGISKAVETIPDGELITVDGHLGIVTVGPPEFDMERRQSGRLDSDETD